MRWPRCSSALDLLREVFEIEPAVDARCRHGAQLGRSQVRRIIEHLLKLEYSPTAQPRLDWRDSVDQARDEIEDHITASMFPEVAADLDKLFGRGRRAAASALVKHGEREAGSGLPTSRPYSLEQILEQDWYPQNRRRLVDD